jgi:hypothetical protein
VSVSCLQEFTINCREPRLHGCCFCNAVVFVVLDYCRMPTQTAFHPENLKIIGRALLMSWIVCCRNSAIQLHYTINFLLCCDFQIQGWIPCLVEMCSCSQYCLNFYVLFKSQMPVVVLNLSWKVIAYFHPMTYTFLLLIYRYHLLALTFNRKEFSQLAQSKLAFTNVC